MNPLLGKVTSVFGNRCPKCHQGHFFIHDNPFRPDFSKMYETCKVCEQPYHLEPGFYYGAMYTSYAINVAIFVIAWIAAEFILPNEASMWAMVGITMAIGLIMVPATFRWSRLLWINFFVSFDPGEMPEKSTQSSSK